MRLKSELYSKEQNNIIRQIIQILDLDNKNTFTLYELDNNKIIQDKIIELIPEMRKWFSFNNMKAIGEPQNLKRPYLSIIKYMLKELYIIETKDFQFTKDNIHIRTKKYIFTKRI